MKRLLIVGLLSLVLPGCTFHRMQSNAAFRDIDPTSITVGESTWRDVLNELGPPSGATTERINAGLNSMSTFRYSCADQKTFSWLFAVLLVLPFKWSDNQTGYELVVELDPEGIVSDLYAVTDDSVWRPFSSPGERQVTFYREEE